MESFSARPRRITAGAVAHCSCLARAVGAGLSAAVLLTGPAALAQEIRVDGDNCASGVHLVAHEAHVADVLKRLAQALDFQLSFESESNPIVSVNAVGDATDLLAQLAPSGNVSMTQARNPRCLHQQRIINVWVLPKGMGGQARPAVSQSKPGSLVETPEQLRQVQEGLEAHTRAHGGGLNGSGQKGSP